MKVWKETVGVTLSILLVVVLVLGAVLLISFFGGKIGLAAEDVKFGLSAIAGGNKTVGLEARSWFGNWGASFSVLSFIYQEKPMIQIALRGLYSGKKENPFYAYGGSYWRMGEGQSSAWVFQFGIQVGIGIEIALRRGFYLIFEESPVAIPEEAGLYGVGKRF